MYQKKYRIVKTHWRYRIDIELSKFDSIALTQLEVSRPSLHKPRSYKFTKSVL